MNRNRRQIPNKIRKQMEKNIKKGMDIFPMIEEILRVNETTLKKELKKYPDKRWKQEKDIASKEKAKVKLKKKQKKHAKRTTPGEIEHHESSPAMPHREGVRWQKTLVKQNKGKRMALTAKLARKKGR